MFARHDLLIQATPAYKHLIIAIILTGAELSRSNMQTPTVETDLVGLPWCPHSLTPEPRKIANVFVLGGSQPISHHSCPMLTLNSNICSHLREGKESGMLPHADMNEEKPP